MMYANYVEFNSTTTTTKATENIVSSHLCVYNILMMWSILMSTSENIHMWALF